MVTTVIASPLATAKRPFAGSSASGGGGGFRCQRMLLFCWPVLRSGQRASTRPVGRWISFG